MYKAKQDFWKFVSWK